MRKCFPDCEIEVYKGAEFLCHNNYANQTKNYINQISNVKAISIQCLLFATSKTIRLVWQYSDFRDCIVQGYRPVLR